MSFMIQKLHNHWCFLNPASKPKSTDGGEVRGRGIFQPSTYRQLLQVKRKQSYPEVELIGEVALVCEKVIQLLIFP